MKRLFLLFLLSLLLTACGAKETPLQPGMGMGGGNGMMERHHAKIPEEYAGLSNLISVDDESLGRGASLYAVNCASCHGDGGMGDGPAGAALDPAPAPVAHSSRMMGNDYLFWRISEGGAPFNTAMPAWKDILDEQARWDLINYIRALGDGTVKPSNGMGGEAYDPEAQATRQEEILAKAVEQGVITQKESDLFTLVHDAAEVYRLGHSELAEISDATEREAAILTALVETKVITQQQADSFNEIHDRLGNSGLMP